MSNIIPVCELPANDEVYLKRDKFTNSGWRTVYPIKDKNGKWLWKNVLIGGSQNLFWVLFVILLFLGFAYVYTHDTAEMEKVVENPCGYCSINVKNIINEEIIDENLEGSQG